VQSITYHDADVACQITGSARGTDTQDSGRRVVGTKQQRLSEVGSKTEAGLACPKCGSTQFKAKRSARGKLIGGTVGVATLGVLGPAAAALAPKSQVRCVACGTTYKRG
jgi:hypothetical protein